jgi:Ca2+-binding RTX toxin-like protein
LARVGRLRRLIAATAAASLVAVALLLAVSSPAALGSASHAEYGGGGGGGGPLDLAVTVTASPAQIDPGAQAIFRIRVNDTTRQPANDLIVAVKLPAGATVGSAQTDRGPGCKTDSAGLTCSLDYLSSDSPVGNVTIVLTLATAGPATLVATAAASQHETDTTNNSAQTTVQVGPSATGVVPTGGTTKSAPAAPVVNVVRGSNRADRLYGTGKNDVIQGGKGNDQLYGAGGNDRIVGGPGKDVIYGGPGNDTVYARDKTKDTVFCGTGKDTVYADKIDKVARDCEKILRTK